MEEAPAASVSCAAGGDGTETPLSRYLSHKLAGLCTYGSCSLPAVDGSMCPQHGVRERRRKRDGVAALQRARREQGLCAACGRWRSETYWCEVCARKKRRAPTTKLATRQVRCEICDVRPATVVDRVAELPFRLCDECHAEEADAPRPPEVTPRDRLIVALGRFGDDGTDISTLVEALGEAGEVGLQRVSAIVQRAVRAGLIAFRGAKMDRTYFVVAAARAGQRSPSAA